MQQRKKYDCDTFPYWCSEEDYVNRNKAFGEFIDDGKAYRIDDKNTPRPWLNYLCNEKFAAVVANNGLGFTFYKSSLLRVTKYEHPIDYLPREFQDGREIILIDPTTGKKTNVFRDAKTISCTHRPGQSVLKTVCNELEFVFTLFVPLHDSAECWNIEVTNLSHNSQKMKISFQQTWTFSHFGIHTAEEGIPYLTIPGKDLDVAIDNNKIIAHSTNPDMPVELFGCFYSPQATNATVNDDIVMNKNREFHFKICTLHASLDLEPSARQVFNIVSAADEDQAAFRQSLTKFNSEKIFNEEKYKVEKQWQKIIEYPGCRIPDKNMQNFLNIWLKNQLFLTFRFVRSGYIGYRDTLQDSWGYTLIDPQLVKKQLIRTLSHMMPDGSCPRNYSPFEGDDADLRKFMDSGTWIPACLSDYIKESGDFDILHTSIPYLDSDQHDSVLEHVWRALELLYKNRGRHGICLTGDGDWNDALEGISKAGDAESAWLTMALFHAQNIMAELYSRINEHEKSNILTARSEELKNILNKEAWDGNWYVYGFTGSGNPIGSHKNTEGKIHLNAQTWAIFTGLTDEEKTEKIRQAVREHLDTPLGPVLMMPPYVEEAKEVGRIANLEPGTFENASIYQHAVTFKIYSDLKSGHHAEAVNTFINLLPTNPDNFDTRRSSEPYCMGNYYCGPTHKRFGQNFFTWFTGNPAWLLKIGFDEICGVKAEFDGLKIAPKVPDNWNSFSVKRYYRNTLYTIDFTRSDENIIIVDGSPIEGNIIKPVEKQEVLVKVEYK